jgi:tRNA pseudouridine38-40 synthase
LIEIGKGKIKPEAIEDIIKAKNRSKAGFSVPAHGLFLERVLYPTKL